MNNLPAHVPLSLKGSDLMALGSGALWWPEAALLCVSDLHLCKSERMARRGGPSLPPYEVQDTLTRLAAAIEATKPQTVVCLGDSFDDTAAARALPQEARMWIAQLQAGRRWIWIEGNHDPGPIDLGGTHLAQLEVGSLRFSHIADPRVSGEVSGHYHPKVTLPTRARRVSRPAFLADAQRIIMPAFGTYTGGLRSDHDVLQNLMEAEARAVLTGPQPVAVPLPR